MSTGERRGAIEPLPMVHRRGWVAQPKRPEPSTHASFASAAPAAAVVAAAAEETAAAAMGSDVDEVAIDSELQLASVMATSEIGTASRKEAAKAAKKKAKAARPLSRA